MPIDIQGKATLMSSACRTTLDQQTVTSAQAAAAKNKSPATVWAKIKDWFCGTQEAKVKHHLYIMFSERTAPQQKVDSFNALKDMAGANFRIRFLPPDGNDTRYRLDLGDGEPVVLFNSPNEGPYRVINGPAAHQDADQSNVQAAHQSQAVPPKPSTKRVSMTMVDAMRNVLENAKRNPPQFKTAAESLLFHGKYVQPVQESSRGHAKASPVQSLSPQPSAEDRHGKWAEASSDDGLSVEF